MEFDFNDPATCNQFHLTQIRNMQRRLVEHVGAGASTDYLPSPLAAPATYYTGQAQLDLERSRIFGSLPLLAGLSSDLPNPGDVLLFDEAGPPIVLTRDRAGKVHAFLNICRHRGARVAQASGSCARLVCRFHGWSYDHQGRLVGLPGADGFNGLDRDKLRLIPVPVTEWQGMLFVSARRDGNAMELDGFLESFSSQLAMLRLADVERVKTTVFQTKANWKLMLDTHGEGYHFATLHPKTIAPSVISNCSVYDTFGPHYRVSFAQKSHAELAKRNDAGNDVSNYASSFLLFPNTVIFVSTFYLGKRPEDVAVGAMDPSAFYVGVYRLFPGAHPGETTTIMTSYRPKAPSPHVPSGSWTETHDFVGKVLVEEDYKMAAEQYANLLHAPSDHATIYGRNEVGIQHARAHIEAFTKNS